MFDFWLTTILYQVITVNSTQPCFLNMSAGVDMWKNCGFDKDYLQAALAPWMWVTGGYFPMILASVFVLIPYIKYQKAIYPIMVGTLFLPISYFVFPQVFLSWAIIMVGMVVGVLIWYAFISQTNEG